MSYVVDLNGNWEFKEYPLSARRVEDLDKSEWFEGSVPNSVFANLMEAGRIDRSDVMKRPEDYGWVSERPWVYRKKFDVSQELLDCDRVELNCEGLDTIATIWLNGKQIGKSDNMFIEHRFDISGMLECGENVLMVKFESPLQHSKALMDRYDAFKITDFWHVYRVYMRKGQYQFGWDFCPAMAGCGIWRDIRIEGVQKARIDQLQVKTIECSEDSADIKISTEIAAAVKDQYRCRLTISGDTGIMTHELSFKAGEKFDSTIIRIDKPSLWWPSGYGDQHLYHVKAELMSGEDVVDAVEKQFGVRTIKLDRSKDKSGERFCFVVNGQDVYVRGANWVPASVFAGSVCDEYYEKLLGMAKEANMNIIRIWGGGYYEVEKFYEICDREGLLVWQDFMFACGYYPEQKWFVDAFKKEAEAAINRLKSHACIAVWCGNNENDWIHSNGWMGNHKKLHGKDIYHKVLPGLLAELDPERDYVYSTPCGDKKVHNDKDSGCIHQWDIGAFHHPMRDYLYAANEVPRFVTEFGMQAVPNMETLRTLCDEDGLKLAKRGVEKHNYQVDGNERLMRYASELFRGPRDIEEWVYISQLTQGRAVKMHAGHLRAYPERNYGVLYWQLADCSGAISWASIDYLGRAKGLYYYAKRLYGNVFVGARKEFDANPPERVADLEKMSVIVRNDSGQPLTGSLNCRLMNLKGEVIDEVTSVVMLMPFKHSAALQLPKEFVKPENPEQVCLHLRVENSGEVFAEDVVLYMPDKYIDWPKADVKHELSQVDGNSWELEVESDVVVKDLCVQIAEDSITFSDNFVDLMPGEKKVITITSAKQIENLENKIRFFSVNNL